MAQKKKDKALTPDQIAVLKREKLQPACWKVLQDLNHSMIVCHKITGDVKVLDK